MPESPAFIGTNWLVQFNGVTVGSQRDATVTRALAVIDVSSKDSRNRRIKPGRYTVEISFDHLYVPGAPELTAIKNAILNGTFCEVREMVNGAAGRVYGGYITGHVESFPDQGPAMVSCTFTGDGPET